MQSPIETQYLRFEFKEQKPKTEVWLVKNKHHGTVLGEIRFFAQWRQYCFIISTVVMKAMLEEGSDLVFSRGCNNDINNFIAQLQAKLRSKKETA